MFQGNTIAKQFDFNTEVLFTGKLFFSLPPRRNKTADGSPVNALALQDLVEKVILLRQAVARERRQFSGPSSSILADKFR